MGKQTSIDVLKASVLHMLAVAIPLALAVACVKFLGMSQGEAVGLFLGLSGVEKAMRASEASPVPDFVNE